MSVMKTSLTIIPNVSLGAPLLLLAIVQAYTLIHKGLGHLAALYLLYLLIACYCLSYHKTIYHLQFRCLQRKPYWKLLIIFFCSSLGSTLLLIERTMIYPLHLWVISSHMFHDDLIGWTTMLRIQAISYTIPFVNRYVTCPRLEHRYPNTSFNLVTSKSLYSFHNALPSGPRDTSPSYGVTNPSLDSCQPNRHFRRYL